jgi:actin-related protein 8
LCVTFGAGMSAACVVDIGATKCTVACVDDGLVLPDSRYAFHYERTEQGYILCPE